MAKTYYDPNDGKHYYHGETIYSGTKREGNYEEQYVNQYNYKPDTFTMYQEYQRELEEEERKRREQEAQAQASATAASSVSPVESANQKIGKGITPTADEAVAYGNDKIGQLDTATQTALSKYSEGYKNKSKGLANAYSDSTSLSDPLHINAIAQDVSNKDYLGAAKDLLLNNNLIDTGKDLYESYKGYKESKEAENEVKKLHPEWDDKTVSEYLGYAERNATSAIQKENEDNAKISEEASAFEKGVKGITNAIAAREENVKGTVYGLPQTAVNMASGLSKATAKYYNSEGVNKAIDAGQDFLSDVGKATGLSGVTDWYNDQVDRTQPLVAKAVDATDGVVQAAGAYLGKKADQVNSVLNPNNVEVLGNDVNSASQILSNRSQARDTANTDYLNKHEATTSVGKALDNVSQTLTGDKFLTTAYNIGAMSADSAISMAMGNGAAELLGVAGATAQLNEARKAGQAISPVLKASSVIEGLAHDAALTGFVTTGYNNTYKNLVNQGTMTEEAAQLSALVSGAAEFATEKVSTDAIFDLIDNPVKSKNVAWRLAKTMIPEGLEEGTSDIISAIAENLVAAIDDESKTEDQILADDVKSKCIEQGMSEDEAEVQGFKAAISSILAEAGQDTLVGALSTIPNIAGAVHVGNQRSNALREAITDHFTNVNTNTESEEGSKSEYDKAVESDRERYAQNPTQFIADTIDNTTDEGKRIKAEMQKIADKEKAGKKLSMSDKMFISDNANVDDNFLREVMGIDRGSTAPNEYRTAKTNVTYDQAQDRMTQAANRGDLEELSQAYNEAKASRDVEANTKADEILNSPLVTGQLEAKGISKDDIQSAVKSTEEAYTAGYMGEEIGNTTARNQEAYNAGKAEGIQQRAKVTINTQDEVRNAYAESKSGESYHLTGKFTQNGVMTTEGKLVKVEDLDTSKDTAAMRAYSLADSYDSVSTKNAFISGIGDNTDIGNYSKDFSHMYDRGLTGMSFESAAKGSVRVMDTKQMKIAYNAGREDAKRKAKAEYKADLAAAFGVVSKGTGTVINESDQEIDSDQNAILEMIANKSKALNIKVVNAVTDANGNKIEGARGAFTAYNSTVQLRADRLSSVAHEVFGEVTKKYNKEGYRNLKGQVMDFLSTKMPTDKLMNYVTGDAYGRLYARSGLDSSADEMSDEMFNDTIAYMLSTEEGAKAFQEWALDNKTEEEAKTLGQKLADILKTIKNGIAKLFSNDSRSFVAEQGGIDMGKFVKQLLEEYDKAIEVLENITVKEESTQTKPVDSKIMNAESGNDIELSMETYETGGKSALEEWLTNYSGLSEKDQKDILSTLDWGYEIAREFAQNKENRSFAKWSRTKLVVGDDGKPLLEVFNKDGKPIQSVAVNNGEYPLNIDFTQVCKKRIALNTVLNKLVSENDLNLHTLTESDINAVNKLIKAHHFEIACGLCFVDAKRYRIGTWAETFTDGKYDKKHTKKTEKGWNDLINDLCPKSAMASYFNFASANPDPVGTRLLSELSDDELNLNAFIKKNIGNYAKYDENGNYIGIGGYKTPSGNQQNPKEKTRMADLIVRDRASRKLLDQNDIIASEGLDTIREENAKLYALINAHWGAGKPKLSHGAIAYGNEILRSIEWKSAKNNFSAQNAYKVGGVRVQSFSDYVANMFFDYMQLFADMSARQLPSHAYTKESDYVLLFGMTGQKINMSLVPRAAVLTAEQQKKYEKLIKKGIKAVKEDPELGAIAERAGLDADGNYIWEDETFDYDKAMEIMEDDRYNKNCGTIAVGVSTAHIRKLLSDDRISMVIPYHASGVSQLIKNSRNIALYKDYTDFQNTRDANGKKLVNDGFDWYAHLKSAANPKGLEAKEVAQLYLDYCDKHHYLPKFDEFRDDPNYYKLLIDFRAYDKEGNFIPQGAVTMTFPEEEELKAIVKRSLAEQQVTEDRMDNEMRDAQNTLYSEVKDVLGLGKLSLEDERMDSTYDEAVKSGNMSKAMDMVEEAAMSKGFTPMVRYHQTGKHFTVFNNNNPVAGLYDSETPDGFFFKDNDHDILVGGKETGVGGSIQMRAYLRTSNMLHFANREEANSWYCTHVKGYKEIQDEWNTVYQNEWQPQFKAIEDEEFSDDITDERYAELDALEETLIADLGESENIYRKRMKDLLNDYFLNNNSGYDGIELDYDGHRWVNGKRENVHTFIVFNANQIKSANAVVYDDDGNVIPLSQRFDTSKDDIRYSLEEDDQGRKLNQQQSQYFKSSQMVDGNGRLKVMYHGTERAGFTVFDPEYSDDGISLFFTDSPRVAKSYSGSDEKFDINRKYSKDFEDANYEVYLNLVNPLVVNGNKSQWNHLPAMEGVNKVFFRFNSFGDIEVRDSGKISHMTYDQIETKYGEQIALKSWNMLKEEKKTLEKKYITTRDYAQFAKHNGYDGVIFNDISDQGAYRSVVKPEYAQVVIAFDSDQVKSIYNKAPTSNKDIRYSVDDDWEELDLIASFGSEYVDILREGMEALKNEKVDKEKVKKIARKFKKIYRSHYDLTTFADNLEKAFAYMQTQDFVDYNTMMGILRDIAKPVIETSGNKVGEEEYKEFRDYFKNKKIVLTDKQLTEVEYTFGSYGKYTRSMMPITISKSGDTKLETIWSELCDAYPSLFSADEPVPSMPLVLMDALESMKPRIENEDESDLEEQSQELAMRIVGEYIEGAAQERLEKAEADYKKKIKAEYARKFKEAKAKILEEEKRKGTNRASAEKIANIKAKLYAQNKKRAQGEKERQLKNQYKAKIASNANKLTKWIDNPSIKNHVPYSMVAPITSFLHSLNFVEPSVKQNDKGQYYLRVYTGNYSVDENGKKKYDYDTFTGKTKQEVLDQFYNMLNNDHGSQAVRTWKDRMRLMQDLFDKAGKETEDEDRDVAAFVQKLSPALAEELRFLIQNGSANINELDSMDLKVISDILSNIVTAVNQGNQAYTMNAEIDVDGNAIINDGHSVKNKEHTKAGQTVLDFVTLSEQSPRTFFKVLGSTSFKYYERIRDGLNVEIGDTKRADEYMRKLKSDLKISEKEVQSWSGKDGSFRQFTLGDGSTIRMTDLQIMSLYESSKRSGFYDRISGGIKVADIQRDFKTTIKQDRSYLVTKDDIDTITKVLKEDPRKIKFADALQKYMAEQCAQDGNEVTMKMYGYQMFTEENYFPFKADPNTIAATDSNVQQAGLNMIKNSSFTKARKEKASNPLIMSDILDVFTIHVAGMAKYHGYTASVTDMLRLLNYKTENHDNVKQAINNLTNSDNGSQYVIKLLMDLNGASKNIGKANRLSDMVISNTKAASVMANLSVVVQQPTAYFRASNTIDWKYLLTVNPKTAFKNMKRISDENMLAWLKSQGYYETNIGRSLKGIITGQESVKDKINDKAGYLAGKADDITWAFLYTAVENEQRAKNKGKGLTEKEFRKAVNDRFDDVVDQTQVIDVMLFKSQYMRDSDGLAKLQTAYMAEPTKSFNMLQEAYLLDLQEYRKTGKWNAKRTSRAVTAWLASSLAAALAKSLITARRHKTDDDDYWDIYKEDLLGEVIGNINPLNLIPWVKDISEEIQNKLMGESSQSLARQDLDSIISLIDSLGNISKMLSGNEYTPYGIMMAVLQPVSSLTGIPVYAFVRDVAAVASIPFGSTPATKYPTTTETKQSIYTDATKGKSEAELKEDIDEATESGISIKDQKSYLEAKSKSDYLEAYNSGDMESAQKVVDTVTPVFRLIGMSDEDIESMVDGWTETDISYSDLDKAIDSGESITDQVVKLKEAGKKDAKIVEHIMNSYGDSVEYERANDLDTGWEAAVNEALQAVDGTYTYDAAKAEAEAKAEAAQEKKEQSEKIAEMKSNLFAATESSDGTSARKAVEDLKAEGKDAGTIKGYISTYYHDAWKNATDSAEKNRIKNYWINATALVNNVMGVQNAKDPSTAWAAWEKEQN